MDDKGKKKTHPTKTSQESTPVPIIIPNTYLQKSMHEYIQQYKRKYDSAGTQWFNNNKHGHPSVDKANKMTLRITL